MTSDQDGSPRFIIGQDFWWKLHENEKNLPEFRPLDRPLLTFYWRSWGASRCLRMRARRDSIHSHLRRWYNYTTIKSIHKAKSCYQEVKNRRQNSSRHVERNAQMSARLPVVTSQEGSASLTSLASLCDNRRCEETLFHQVTPPRMFCNCLMYHKYQGFAYTAKQRPYISYLGYCTPSGNYRLPMKLQEVMFPVVCLFKGCHVIMMHFTSQYTHFHTGDEWNVQDTTEAHA